MTRNLWFVWLIVVVIGCSPSEEKPTPEPTVPPVPHETESRLDSLTGPYLDALPLLDGVCFEYLYTLGGQSWIWTGPEDLNAFYDRVDDSGLCGDPVIRATLDFREQVLVGAVQVALGCDAAFQFVELVQDDTTRTQTIILRYLLQSGCDYELVQPFLIVVPRPSDGYSLQVVVTS